MLSDMLIIYNSYGNLSRDFLHFIQKSDQVGIPDTVFCPIFLHLMGVIFCKLN